METRKTESAFQSVQLADIWPAVELSAEGVPSEEILQWAQERIVELKSCNLRFIRGMDIAEVDPGSLPEEFSGNLEFFGTADTYLTLTLHALRTSSCTPEEIPTLFNALSMLAASLGEARKHMLSTMSENLRTIVLESESQASAGPEDVEEELAELRRFRVQRRRAKKASR
ncbi:MAG: hypothetical protein JSW03_06250 [Candidatus Eiseniibacteriota bacterium]|nr:MAG: hypothetical protein JSW03_06250 [Candidatus Eisenbacteria bacterium]